MNEEPERHKFVPGQVATGSCQAPDPWGVGDRCYLPESAPVHARTRQPGDMHEPPSYPASRLQFDDPTE